MGNYLNGVNYANLAIGTGLTASAVDQFGNVTLSAVDSAPGNETGTGLYVLQTSPTLVTPALGVATATSINGLTISTTTGTVALANSSTFTTVGAFGVTLTATGTTSLTLPAVTDTVAVLATAQTLALKTLTNPVIVMPETTLNNRFYSNFATAGQTPAATTRTYITGSAIGPFTAATIAVGTIFRWKFDMTKTAAGSASSTFDIAFGTAGTTGDTAYVSFTKPAGTAAGDQGWVEISAVVKTAGASGVILGNFRLIHNLAATGHATIPCVSVVTTSGTVNLATPTYAGICITSGASDAITINQVEAEAIGL
jgi:hypothetical protein